MYSMLENINEITTSQLKELSINNIYLLDVREVFEYEMVHIEGAVNIPMDYLDEVQVSREQPIYIICARGNRSLRACVTLQQRGYRCINVKGGMAMWDGRVIESNEIR